MKHDAGVLALTRAGTNVLRSGVYKAEYVGWLLILIGAPMGNTNVGIAVLLACALGRLVTRPESVARGMRPRDGFYVVGWAFFGATMVSAATARDPGMALLTGLSFLVLFLFIVRGSRILVRPNVLARLDDVMLVVACATIVGSLYALYTYFIAGSHRAYAVSVGINGLGTISALTALVTFAFGWLVGPRSRWRAGVAWTATALAVAALVVSFSRGGWLGFIVSGVLFVYLLVMTRTIPAKTACIGVGAGAGMGAVLFWAFPAVYERFISAFSITSNLDRMTIWTLTASIIRDHPVTGIGGGNFQTVYEAYQLQAGMDPVPIVFAHNIVLHIVAEYGIVGAVPFFAMIGIVAVRGWRLARRGGLVTAALYAGFWGMIAHDVVDNVTYGFNAGGVFWLVAGVLLHRYERVLRQDGDGNI